MKLKDLLAEYHKTDSIKKTSKLISDIESLCEDFWKRKIAIATKFKIELNDEYCSENGSFCYKKHDGCNEEFISLTYSNRWEDCFSYDFAVKEVDNFDENDFGKQCIEERKKKITSEISWLQNEIKSRTKQQKLLSDELEALNNEKI